MEGVVDALNRIHAALVPGGLVIDAQPIAPRPRVRAGSDQLGSLETREFDETVVRIDQLTAQAPFDLLDERHYPVDEWFSSGPEALERAGNWWGTTIPRGLRSRLETESRRVAITQGVRLRVLRARLH